MSRIPAPCKVFFLAFIAYALSAQVWAHAISLAPHYVYLAYALLQRHVDLIQLPPVTYDLLQHDGQWFVAGSPLPAILLLPFVAIFGVGFSDVLFSVVLGAIDVALVYSLLGIFTKTTSLRALSAKQSPSEQVDCFVASFDYNPKNTRTSAQDAPRNDVLGNLARVSVPIDDPQVQPSQGFVSESARRWITLLFALGTPFWYLASFGTVWFTAQVVAVLFTLLAVREALTRQRWFLAGLWLACAGLARPTALFLAPFFLVIIYYAARSRAEPPVGTPHLLITRYVLHPLFLFSLAIVLGIAAHFAYNYVRFKSFTDFGYAYVAGAENITSTYARYGGFNPGFAPCNLAVSLLSPPEVNGAVPDFITQPCAYLLEGVNLSDTSASIMPNPLGMSVFVVTPALLIVFATLWQTRKPPERSRASSKTVWHSAQNERGEVEGQRPRWGRGLRDPLIVAAWVGLLTTLIPLWLYHNTGSLQFGYRYLFDAAPMWIILLAAGMQKMTHLNRGLILASVAINLWGFLWMFEKLNGVSWW